MSALDQLRGRLAGMLDPGGEASPYAPTAAFIRRLATDAELRERFAADPHAVLWEAGVSPIALGLSPLAPPDADQVIRRAERLANPMYGPHMPIPSTPPDPLEATRPRGPWPPEQDEPEPVRPPAPAPVYGPAPRPR